MSHDQEESGKSCCAYPMINITNYYCPVKCVFNPNRSHTVIIDKPQENTNKIMNDIVNNNIPINQNGNFDGMCSKLGEFSKEQLISIIIHLLQNQ